MPIIYEYLGMTLRFYSREHLPPHVHALYGEYEMKVEFYLKDNKIVKIKYKKKEGFKKFPSSKRKELEKLIEKYKEDIVEKFIKFAVKGQRVTKKVIKTKIK